jgi:competence protein ComEC
VTDFAEPSSRHLNFALNTLLALCAVLVWWLALRPAPPRLIVTFLDVGQGDAIVVQTPSGQVMAIDAGRSTPEGDEGRRTVIPFLRAQGIHRLNGLLLTHPDDDHAGGAVSILEQIPVDRLFINGAPSDAPVYRRALETAQKRGAQTVALAQGQRLDFRDGVRAEVLNPPSDSLSDHRSENDHSLVLRLVYGETELLLTGDAESKAEEEMLRSRADLRADVLKLGHHGSRTATSESFLEAVRPQAAIVSAGPRNLYGHPHAETIQRLEARHIPLFRTDQNGAVTVTSDGRLLRIVVMQPGR